MHTDEYRSRDENRFWWWRIPGITHDPLIYMLATEEEKSIFDSWYEDTNDKRLIGECAPPLVSFLLGLISGNSVERVVQLGHYAGYSTLHVGMMFRKMGKGKLFTIDIVERMSDYTRSWVDKAGLDEFVEVATGDSADPVMRDSAIASLGGMADIVIIDSSHKYDHTIRELDLWYPVVRENGFILLHDASNAAREYDPENGAVAGALEDWCAANSVDYFVLNGGGATPARSHRELVYRDGRGLGIIQKRAKLEAKTEAKASSESDDWLEQGARKLYGALRQAAANPRAGILKLKKQLRRR